MRNNLIPAAVALVMITVPSSAVDIGHVQEPVAEIQTAGPLPLQAAVDIANGIGLISVSNTNKWGNEWQVEAMTLPEAIWKSMLMRAPARS